MKKRVLALVLAVIMLLAMVPVVAFATEFAKVEFSASSAEIDLKKNTVATVTISIDKNPGLCNGLCKISAGKFEGADYDFADVFTYDVPDGDIIPSGPGFAAMTVMGNEADGTVGWYAVNNTTTTGEAFTCTFNVSPNALNGTYEIVFTFYDMYNNDGTVSFTAESVSGYITIKNGLNKQDFEPQITGESGNVEYTYDPAVTTAELSVTATVKAESAELTYQWYNEDGTKAEGEGATSATFKPVLPAVDSSATYYCVVTATSDKGAFIARSEDMTVTHKKADQNGFGYEVEHTTYGDTDLTDNIKIVDAEDHDISENCTYFIDGRTYTYEELKNLKLNVGTYECVATIAGDENHNDGTRDFPLKIEKATPVLNVAPTTLTVVKGLTESLTVTLTGVDGDVLTPTYKSGKTSVATVDANGLITGVKEGETTITVSFKGDNYYNKVDDVKVTVTVTNKLSAEVTFAASATEKTYTEAGYTLGDFITAEATADQADGEITYSFGGQTYTWEELKAVSVKNVGTYEITAQFVSDTHVGSATVTVEIEKAEQAALDVTVADGITYGDDLSEVVTVTGGSSTGTVTYTVKKGEDEVFNGTDLSTCELDAGEYTVEVTKAGDDNYNAVSAEAALVINKVKVAIPTAKTGLVYNGTAQVGVEDGEHYYVVSDGSYVNAGSYQAGVSLKDTTNYEWSEPFGGKVEWQIDKAAAENLNDEVSLRYNDTTAKNILDMIVGKLPGAETMLAVKSAATESALVVIGEDKTTFALADGLEEQEAAATIEVVFTALNYEESTMTITVNVMKKEALPEGALTIDGGSLIYNGKAQTWEKAKLKSGYNKANLTYTYSGNMTDAGSYTVTVVYDDGVNYGEASAAVTINPAKPTIKFTKSGIKKDMILDELIENGNLTVTVTFGGETVTGTFAWNEEEGTEIKRGKSYNYTFTPDSANFQAITGKYKPLASSSGGGGGSSSSSVTYVDVHPSDWFSGAVDYVTNMGLMNGTGDGTTFEPNADVTRAMVVVTLWRMEGSPEVKYDMAFNDVADGLWYTEAIRWAASKGIVTGYDDGTAFGPTDVITREQLSTMLYRYADRAAASGDPLASFPDGAATSAWAKQGMSWAVSTGLLNGDGEGKLDPTDTASRAELATILMRYVQTVR